MQFSTSILLLLTLSISAISADQVREIWVFTAECADCGMTSLGQLTAKVCGQGSPMQPGGRCCMAVHMANNNNNYQEGVTDIFAGPSSLVECYNFELGTLPGTAEDIAITLYHDGTDGGRFDWVRVFTNEGQMYQCDFGQFMDGTSWAVGSGCVKLP